MTKAAKANTATMAQIKLELAAVSESPTFRRSGRSRSLLFYLIRHGLLNGGEPLNELAIGLNVFQREAASYDPAIDPIVRVEMGRLRQRLAKHYHQTPNKTGWRLVIPLGSYQAQCVSNEVTQGYQLVFTPLQCLSSNVAAQNFTRQLNQLLYHHLELNFGRLQNAQGADGAHVINGHVRCDDETLMTAFYMQKNPDSHQTWSTIVSHTIDITSTHLQDLCRLCVSAVSVALD